MMKNLFFCFCLCNLFFIHANSNEHIQGNQFLLLLLQEDKMRAGNCLFCAGKGEIPCTEDWDSLAKKRLKMEIGLRF